ncbi:MAG: hypothetical protein JW915_00825 [Chitinispirillaceae bacterium]|nr:hypothetical protein [Chitinispirillaceae bacterium]
MSHLYSTIASNDEYHESSSGPMHKIKVVSVNGKINIRSACDGIATIVALNGNVLKKVTLSAGSNTIIDTKGFVVVQFVSPKGMEFFKVVNRDE